MSRALASLAARYVGRRVELTGGRRGTISRITGRGIIVTLEPVTGAEIVRYLD